MTAFGRLAVAGCKDRFWISRASLRSMQDDGSLFVGDCRVAALFETTLSQ